MLIDRYLPSFDETYIYEASVTAPPDATYAAMKETNLRDPVIDLLFELRELPRNLTRRWRGEAPLPSPPRVTFDELPKQGPTWVVLSEEPGVELVIGAVGRFWKQDYGTRAITEPEFSAFAEPGFAKLAISLAVRPTSDGAILRYEARTRATDESARRTFRRYWRVIGAGVGIVIRRVVRRIKREAEQRAPVAPACA
jgi:hypothetical protein